MYFTKKINLTSLALLAFVSSSVLAQNVDISLLLLSDVYKMEGSGERGGFSRAAAVVRDYRATHKNLIYIHAGDTISPSLLSSIDMGQHVIDLLNVEPPDIFVPGNHEFDFGPEVFEDLILHRLNSSILASNLRDGNGKSVNNVLDALFFDFDGVRVGVYGLVTDETEILSSPGPYKFGPMLATAQRMSKQLRDHGADIVVAVVHDSFSIDYEIIAKGGADVVLSGSDHDLNIQYNGKVAFAEARSEADYMIAVNLSVKVTEKDGKRRVRWWPNFDIIDTATYQPAADAAAQVARYEAYLDDQLGDVIGITTTALDTRRNSVRGGENAFANLMADSIRDFVNSDVGFTNGGGIRANREYAPNTELTRRDILKELPFGNSVVMLEVTGAQLRAALENGVSAVEDGAGRFPHISGIQMVFDAKAQAGARLKSVQVNGKPLADGATYTVATNDYIAGGGDGYASFKQAKVIKAAHETQLLATTVMNYIKAKGSVAPKLEGRIKF